MGSYTPGNMAAEQNIYEELSNNSNDNIMGATGPPDKPAMISGDNAQAESAQTEHNGPIHDRCVHGEINTISCPLNISKAYFRIADPYELQPVNKYFLHTPRNTAAMQNTNEELANNSNYNNMGATGPADQSAIISGNNGQAESALTEHNGSIHDRCVYGEINVISCPLDRSEDYFRITHPYELEPLSKYYQREWSEAEHLFKSAMDFAEEMYSDWSPCPSLSLTNTWL